MTIRSYQSSDYEQVVALYQQSKLYGGQFDEDRDSKERLQKRIVADPESILVAEKDGQIVGTVSLIEDVRVAWLFRFCVSENDNATAQALVVKAIEILKQKGHQQILVYSPIRNKTFDKRYEGLGFNKGSDYTCFWKKI